MNLRRIKAFAVAVVLVASFQQAVSMAPASAVGVTDDAPSQLHCDGGGGSSLTYTWSGLGIARPVIASMKVDGQTIPDPANPDDGKLGAIVCPNVPLARKTGLTVIKRTGSSLHSNLAGALLPNGSPLTATSDIEITLTNLGGNAQYYSFSLVHGIVQQWTTANLGTTSASLSVKLKPATINLLSSPGFCSATPPNCTANQSDLDITGASLDMDFDQAGSFSAFTGAYFGLDSAISGFVQPTQDSTTGEKSIKATLGAPHLLDDGSPNVGSMQAFLPTSVLADLFALTPTQAANDGLEVSRTEGSSISDAAPVISAVAGGVVVAVDDITFSSPIYSIEKASGSSGSQRSSADGAYRLFGSDGGVFNYGYYKSHGSATSVKLAKPIVGGHTAYANDGYYLVSADGGVFSYGDAPFHGSAGAIKLAKPIVGMDGNGDDSGYRLVASDGGVFAYGETTFRGSAASLKLKSPVVGIATAYDGDGYYLVAADGGVFAYGDAKFYGSAGALKLRSPIVGMKLSPTGHGYYLVAADGGVFAYGDAQFYGSAASVKLAQPIVGITQSYGGEGYVLVAADGGVFAYGDARFIGSPSNLKLGGRVVGID